ncbi:hypothetical protein QAD02_013110 [Eretmocerus hayati]|uniref:Uncharacterized protein n=1 Tax=Eretmocerus hayati TaxID=131215 RepID=A0ACC2P2J9_9HYME|nr:hypothetical protein QAD02_013110 [Eretmocerus hayati]
MRCVDIDPNQSISHNTLHSLQSQISDQQRQIMSLQEQIFNISRAVMELKSTISTYNLQISQNYENHNNDPVNLHKNRTVTPLQHVNFPDESHYNLSNKPLKTKDHVPPDHSDEHKFLIRKNYNWHDHDVQKWIQEILRFEDKETWSLQEKKSNSGETIWVFSSKSIENANALINLNKLDYEIFKTQPYLTNEQLKTRRFQRDELTILSKKGYSITHTSKSQLRIFKQGETEDLVWDDTKLRYVELSKTDVQTPQYQSPTLDQSRQHPKIFLYS